MSEQQGEGRKISLLDIFGLQNQHSPQAPAFVLHGENSSAVRTLSFSDACECIQSHKVWLLERITEISTNNILIQDVVVAYLSSNSIDMFLSMMACTSRLGAPNLQRVAALLNTRWSPEEMAQALFSHNPNEAATILLYGDGFEEVANHVAKKLGHASVCMQLPKFSIDKLQPLQQRLSKRTATSSSWSLSSQLGSSFTVKDIAKNGHDRDAFIVFTSGTTGGSKGVRLSHRAIAIQSMAKILHPCHYSSETSMLASTVPLFHIGGISSFLAVLFAGGTLILPGPCEARFDPQMTKVSLEHLIFPTNTLVVVPAMLVSLLAELDVSVVYPAVRLILIGGQSASQVMTKRLVQTFPNARIVQTYACTEAASSLTFWHFNANHNEDSSESQKMRGDCVGHPPAHVHLRLYRKEGKSTKIVTLPYVAGIIATRGPHLMTGYWFRGALEPSDNPTGWYWTNDLGFWDKRGKLYFCGRVRDVIRSGGETIMAQEVERVLLQNPDIQDCAVFPKKDHKFGEAVACAIVTRGDLKLEGIKKWCEQQGLASYKRPRYVYKIKELPRNSSGKVLKHELVMVFGRIQSKL